MTRVWPALTLVLALGGIALRWMWLGSESLWFDEGYTAWVATLSPWQMIRAIRADTSPPLYYLILRGWVIVFGDSEFALRALSTLSASLAMVVFLLLARRVLRHGPAVFLATALFAASVIQLRYAQEARFYGFMSLLALLDVFLLIRLQEKRSVGRFLAVAVCWTASLYTNNMMAIYLAAVNVAALVWPTPPDAPPRAQRRKIRDLVALDCICGLLFLPWVPILLEQAKAVQENFWPVSPTGVVLVKSISQLLGANDSWPSPLPGPVTAYVVVSAAAVVVGVGLFRAGMKSRSGREALALLLFALLPVAFVFLYSRVRQSIFMDRAFIASTGVLPIVLAWPIAVAADRGRRPLMWIASAGALTVVGLSIVSSVTYFKSERKEDWRGAARYVLRPDDVPSPSGRRLVVFMGCEGQLLFDYYARQWKDDSQVRDALRNILITGVPAGFFDRDPPKTMRRVRGLEDLNRLADAIAGNTFAEVVLVESHFWFTDRERTTLAMLHERMHEIARREFVGQFTVWRFVPR